LQPFPSSLRVSPGFRHFILAAGPLASFGLVDLPLLACASNLISDHLGLVALGLHRFALQQLRQWVSGRRLLFGDKRFPFCGPAPTPRRVGPIKGAECAAGRAVKETRPGAPLRVELLLLAGEFHDGIDERLIDPIGIQARESPAYALCYRRVKQE